MLKKFTAKGIRFVWVAVSDVFEMSEAMDTIMFTNLNEIPHARKNLVGIDRFLLNGRDVSDHGVTFVNMIVSIASDISNTSETATQTKRIPFAVNFFNI
jgi:hypothetical protein